VWTSVVYATVPLVTPAEAEAARATRATAEYCILTVGIIYCKVIKRVGVGIED
jgi:hypothetical protein